MGWSAAELPARRRQNGFRGMVMVNEKRASRLGEAWRGGPGRGGLGRGALGALLAAIVCLFGAPALAAPVNVPPEELARMGFVPAGTDIPIDGYARLLVSLYVPGSQTDATMNKCPKQGIWGIDVTNITKGDNHTTFGVQITPPGGGAAVTLTPLDFSKKASGFFGASSDCNLKVDVIRYLSPLYFVSRAQAQQFAVAPTYATSDELSPILQQELNAAIGAATQIAGVPAATAAPYLAVLKTGLASAKVSTADTFIQHPMIDDGPAQAPLTWTVEGAIRKTKTTPAQDIVLIAQIVPVAAIVRPSGGAWLPGWVLGSAFNVNVPGAPTTTDGTIGGYISATAPNELVAYMSATDEAANVACGALRRKIDLMGLSDDDRALVMWAEARQRVTAAKSTGAFVDNMSCLDDFWPALAAKGVSRTPVIPPPPAGQAPTVAQMKTTTDIDNAFAMFFVSAAWTDQIGYADKLFTYPVTLNDGAAAAFRGSAQIRSSDGWPLNEFQRDLPVLAQVGCYAYFDLAADTTGFAKAQGARSLMLAIGRVAASGSSLADKEVALQVAFKNTPGGADPRIEQVDIATTLSPEARDAMRAQIGKTATHCPSGYKPQLLFGN